MDTIATNYVYSYFWLIICPEVLNTSLYIAKCIRTLTHEYMLADTYIQDIYVGKF